MQNNNFEKLKELYRYYIADCDNSCLSQDEFIFYNGDGSYADSDSYSDAYSDNW